MLLFGRGLYYYINMHNPAINIILWYSGLTVGFPGGSAVKNPPATQET